MIGSRIVARAGAIFFVTLISLIGGSIPAYTQIGHVSWNLFGMGATNNGTLFKTLHVCDKDILIYFSRGGVSIHKYNPQPEEIKRLFTAPPNIDVIYATRKEYSTDFLIELSDGTLYYGKFDRGTCTWSFIQVTPISVGSSASPKKVVGDALYALSTADVQVSRDTGRTWREDIAGLGSDVLTDIALDTLQFVYGVSPTHLYKQHPDSSVWRMVPSYPGFTGSEVASVFVDRRNRIFVGAGSNGIYMSTDNGTTWKPDTAGMGKVQVLSLRDDAFGNIYAPLGSWLYRSVGGTQPWVRIDGGLTALTGTGVAINAVGGDSLIIAATNFGLFSSTDQGITWSDVSQRLPADNVTGVVQFSSGKVCVAGPRGIYSKNATDTVWMKSYPQGSYQAYLPLTGDALGNMYTIDASFPGTHSGYGYPVKSTDQGVSWNLDTSGVSSLFSGGIIRGEYYVDESGGQHASLWPGTSSWFPYKKDPGGMWMVDTAGMHIDPSSGDGQLAISGDGKGNVYCSNANTGMFKRSVTGTVWMPDTAGLGTAHITRLCKGLNGDIYGSAYGGAYFVRRTGVWTKLEAPSGAAIGFTGAISVDGKGAFFVAASSTGFPRIGEGVYFTKDDGQSWTKAGLDSLTITILVSYGDTTYALTNNRGAYILTTGTTEVQNKSQTPLKFVLLQNFPNPFNPTTIISFQLPVASNVKLVVYDMLGREVFAPVNERKAPGSYQVRFDGSNLSSGVYYYRLTAGSFVQTLKLLLLK
jgi:photosystem II stability/assembly factor-like uncharacterized protein